MSLWSTTFSDDYSDGDGCEFGINIEKVFLLEDSSDSGAKYQSGHIGEENVIEEDYFTIVAERNDKIYGFSDFNNLIYEATPDKIYENKYIIRRLDGYGPVFYGEILFKGDSSCDVFDSNKKLVCNIVVEGFSYTKFHNIKVSITVHIDNNNCYVIESSQLTDDGELRTFLFGSGESPYIRGCEQLANHFLIESYLKMSPLVLYGLMVSLFRKMENRNKLTVDDTEM